jgi:large subunit ribosomal protein L21
MAPGGAPVVVSSKSDVASVLDPLSGPGDISGLNVHVPDRDRRRDSSMYAVFETGGKQFRVEPGTRHRIPSLAAEPGQTVTFERVLLAGDGSEVKVGAPLVKGATVTAEVLRHGREKKVIIFKRKRRKNYRKKQGHRQGFTEIKVSQVAL